MIKALRSGTALLAVALAASIGSATRAASPTEAAYAIKDANQAVKTECTFNDAVGNFIVCHAIKIWNGTGFADLLADPSSNYLGVTLEGSPTVNLGALNGAALAANQPSLNGDGGALAHITNWPANPSTSTLQAATNGYLATLAGAVTGSNVQVTCTSGCSGGSGGTPTGSAGSPSASVLTVQGAASMTPLKVDGSAVVQPISAGALPLPAGAASATNQASEITALGQLHTDLQSGLTVAPSNAVQAHTDAAAIAGNTAHPGSGAMAAVSTTAVTNGFALAVGVIGTRVYLPTSADSITYSVEPAATCGVSAPAVTVSATGPTTVDENLVGEVICIVAATGAPRARAY